MKAFFKSLALMLIIAIASLLLHPFLWIVFEGWFNSETMLMILTFLLIYIIEGGLIHFLCRKMSWIKQAFAIFLSVNFVLVILSIWFTYTIKDGLTGIMFLTMCIINSFLSSIPIFLGCYFHQHFSKKDT